MKRLVFILFVSLFLLQIKAQIGSYSKRHTLKLSAYSIPEYTLGYSLDYEYNIFNFRLIKLYIEASVGQYFQLVRYNEYCCTHTVANCLAFSTVVNSLYGKKSHYLELSTGSGYYFADNTYNGSIKSWLPIINVGYRYQNPEGKGLILRTFIGTQGIGVSVGKKFGK